MNNTNALLPHIKLRFNMEHPGYEECYLFGYECAVSEVAEEENPFRIGSRESEQWLEGWWAGAYGEQPLFNWNSIEPSSAELEKEDAANDQYFCHRHRYMSLFLEISGAIAASAIVGYQILELVA